MDIDNLTPMMKQYWAAKNTLDCDHILLFRLGDFYEMFYEDAKVSSKLLEIVLTHRGDVPMCGVPAHAVENYIKRLLSFGKKVAICEQTSPTQKGSIVTRAIVEKITPGTISNSVYLDSKANNFLAAIVKQNNQLVYAWIDVSTSDLCVKCKEYSIENMRMLLGNTQPMELIFPESQDSDLWIVQMGNEFSLHCTAQKDWNFSIEEGDRQLRRILRVETFKSYGLTTTSLELSALCALLSYIDDTGIYALKHITSVKKIDDKEYLSLDADALYNLEIYTSMKDQNRQYSLIGVLDNCETAMGSRKMVEWISFPLTNRDKIISRQEKIDVFLHDDDLKVTIQHYLNKIVDIPRMMTRVSLNKAHAKNLIVIRESLKHSLKIVEHIQKSTDRVQNVYTHLFPQSRLVKVAEAIVLLENAITSDPPIQFGAGYIIRSEYNAELARLRSLRENHQEILTEYVAREQIRVPFLLRLKYNNAIGYFFDVAQGQRRQCPDHFILRKSLTKQDRYKTSELISLETEILDAEHILLQKEELLFHEVCNSLRSYLVDIKMLSGSIAAVDVYVTFANIARENKYSRPEITNGFEIDIELGRHPVIERHLFQGEFIANSMKLQKETQNFIMLTGPNMSGKSTYLRQNALIIIMAQIGSYVPAQSAKIGIRDKIFCRVGASDNLVKGESTFLIEMSETAFILQQATEKSLVIMDEIGRGTSVLDGESIAQAVAEFFLDAQIPTLFATHYHNLTDLSYPQMRNYTLSIEQENDTIIFTRHIKEGAVKNSYGIEVAKLAGIPDIVLQRAKQLLSTHTHASLTLRGIEDKPQSNQLTLGLESLHVSTIDNETRSVLEEIIDLDINSLTPLQAFQLLLECQNKLKAINK